LSRRTRRADATSLLIATQVDLSVVMREGISSGNPIDALANDPSLQALPLHLGPTRRHGLNVRDTNRDPVHPSPKPGHAPTRSLARCSATLGSSLRGLADASCRSLGSPRQRRSWGSLLFAGLLPHPGDAPSLANRAHLPFSFSVRPIDFRRADFTAHSGRKNESKQSSGKSWIELNVRLLGFTPVCGPFPSFFFSLGKRSCPELFPLAGLRPRTR
jgi:hypothetical protein